MRKALGFIAVTLFLALPAAAQKINIDIPGLSERASEVVDVTLDAQMLRVASRFFSDKTSDEKALRDMVNGLEGIYVRSYEFDKTGEYDRGVVDNLRSQLTSDWKKIVNVRSRDRENVEVFLNMRGDAVRGLFVISAEPRELTIVNIVGPIDIDRLGNLEGQFGIPKMSMEKGKQ